MYLCWNFRTTYGGYRNRVGKGLSFRHARLHRLRNRFLDSLKFKNTVSGVLLFIYSWSMLLAWQKRPICTQFFRKPVLCWQAVRGDRGEGEDLPVHAAGPRGGALHQAHSARSVSSLLQWREFYCRLASRIWIRKKYLRIQNTALKRSESSVWSVVQNLFRFYEYNICSRSFKWTLLNHPVQRSRRTGSPRQLEPCPSYVV